LSDAKENTTPMIGEITETFDASRTHQFKSKDQPNKKHSPDRRNLQDAWQLEPVLR